MVPISPLLRNQISLFCPDCRGEACCSSPTGSSSFETRSNYLSLYRGARPRVRRASFTDSRVSPFMIPNQMITSRFLRTYSGACPAYLSRYWRMLPCLLTFQNGAHQQHTDISREPSVGFTFIFSLKQIIKSNLAMDNAAVFSSLHTICRDHRSL